MLVSMFTINPVTEVVLFAIMLVAHGFAMFRFGIATIVERDALAKLAAQRSSDKED